MSKLFTFWVVVVFTIFNTTFALSANVSVKVTVTKTADLGMPEINEIVSKVNTTALSGAMQANYSLPDKQNLTVHMVFYHQKYIGALELKNENTLTTDQYVQEWKTTHNTGNHILFLFTWNESNNPATGTYANKIKTMLQQQPRKTVAKLRDIGVDKESLLSLARLLFASTSDQAYLNVINSINDAY